jgi:hypothetical protein
MGVALTAAILAAVAAIAASLSSHHESECVLDQIKASDQWAYYQAKGIKENTAALEARLLQAMGKPSAETEGSERYQREKEEIRAKAEELTVASEHHMALHRTFSRTVTLSQIAIAVAAVSVLTKKRPFWFVSMCFGAAGLYFLVRGLTV